MLDITCFPYEESTPGNGWSQPQAISFFSMRPHSVDCCLRLIDGKNIPKPKPHKSTRPRAPGPSISGGPRAAGWLVWPGGWPAAASSMQSCTIHVFCLFFCPLSSVSYETHYRAEMSGAMRRLKTRGEADERPQPAGGLKTNQEKPAREPEQ